MNLCELFMIDISQHHNLQFLIQYGFWLAIPLMIIEGPITTILMAFFASFGYFNIYAVFAAGFFADLISDSVYYAIGHFSGPHFIDRFGKYFKLSKRTLPAVKKFYHEHGAKSVFFAKILTGVVPPIFIIAGYSKMNLKKFYKYAALGGLIWTAAMVALGYFFGEQLEKNIDNLQMLFQRTGIILISLIILVFIYKFYVHRLIEKHLKILLDGIAGESDRK